MLKNEKDKHQMFHDEPYRLRCINVCTAAQQLAAFVYSAISAGFDKSFLVKSIEKNSFKIRKSLIRKHTHIASTIFHFSVPSSSSSLEFCVVFLCQDSLTRAWNYGIIQFVRLCLNCLSLSPIINKLSQRVH